MIFTYIHRISIEIPRICCPEYVHGLSKRRDEQCYRGSGHILKTLLAGVYKYGCQMKRDEYRGKRDDGIRGLLVARLVVVGQANIWPFRHEVLPKLFESHTWIRVPRF
jgi:hypothetical protein